MSRAIRKANRAARTAKHKAELMRKDALRIKAEALSAEVTVRRRIAALVESRFWRWVLGV
jgi:hypothetical protein